MPAAHPDSYDVFFSLAGPDRVEAEPVVHALRRRGLRVFLDRDSIEHHNSITGEIEQALSGSRLLVAYYSRAYPQRYACQFELTAALLASQQEGRPGHRVIVINPDDPDSEHIQPSLPAGNRYELLPDARDDRAMQQLVDRVAARVAAIDGTLAHVRFADHPRWYGDRFAGAMGFVGRYREQWQLHSALDSTDKQLVQQILHGPVAVIAGLPLIGKTTMVAAYAWQFGAAHRGGVYWISLAGATAADALERYEAELRILAETLRLAVPGPGRRHLVGALADHLYRRREPSLWVVDDVPADLDPTLVHQLLVPAGALARTILVTTRDAFAGVLPGMVLGSMADADARLVLTSLRPLDGDDPSERAAFETVLARLGGHPYALLLAGRALRDGQGVLGYTHYADLLAQHPGSGSADSLELVTRQLQQVLGSLDGVQRLILWLAALGEPADLPSDLITVVVEAVRNVDGAAGRGVDAGAGGADGATAGAAVAARVGRALAGLRDLTVASRLEDTAWRVEPIALAALREQYAPPVPLARLAEAAAQQMVTAQWRGPALRLGGTGGASDTVETGGAVETGVAAESVRLMRFAARLVDGGLLPERLGVALERILAEHHERRGAVAAAAKYRDRIIERGSEDPADLLASARAALAAGGYERAIARARGVVTASEAVTAPDAATVYAARLVLASAMDALGQLRAAEAHWVTLGEQPAPEGVAPVEQVRAQVAHARALLLRGQFREAEDRLARLLAEPDTGVSDEHQLARLELAGIQRLTDAQVAARHNARLVLDHYRARGLLEHTTALAAREVLDEAQVTLQFTELRVDQTRWERAVRSLRERVEQSRAEHGPTHPHTLAAEVRHGYALCSVGRSEVARVELERTVAAARLRFDDRHQLYLRAVYLLGLAHAQLGDFAAARGCYQRAYQGQRDVLGPLHPDTLFSQCELGVALKMTGDDQAARVMMGEVRRAAPRSVGRATDLYGKVVAAKPLMVLPGFVWRSVVGRQRRRP